MPEEAWHRFSPWQGGWRQPREGTRPRLWLRRAGGGRAGRQGRASSTPSREPGRGPYEVRAMEEEKYLPELMAERQPGPVLPARLVPAGRRNWKISRFWWKKWRWRREISWCHQQQKYKALRKGIDSCQTVSKGSVSVEDFWWQSLSLWFKRTGCNCARPLKTAEGKLSKSDSSCSQFSAPLPSTSWCELFPSKPPGKPRRYREQTNCSQSVEREGMGKV